MQVPRELEHLVAALKPGGPPRSSVPPGASSVLAPIVPHPTGLHFLLTRRTMRLSNWSGDLSFPGGRIDDGDATPLDAALRETLEEIGLPSNRIHVLGHFSKHTTHLATQVYSFVGLVEPNDVPSTPASPDEVEELLLVPFASLLRPATKVPHAPGSYLATGYEARTAGSVDLRNRVVHYWPFDRQGRAMPRKTVLWGLTADMVSRMLRIGFDWTPPAAPRTITRLEEFQP